MPTYQSCPWCKDAFKSIGQHWVHNTRHAPEATKRQQDILTALLLGTGAYTGPLESPSVAVDIGKERTAEWLEDELESLVVSVDSHERFYRLKTPSNPALRRYFQNWYSMQEEPEPPSTTILTPLIASVWFAVNGETRDNGAVHLKASYGAQNLGWHLELFREEGFNPWREDPRLVSLWNRWMTS